MQTTDLFKVKDPEIRALHLTWIAFFVCFYTWFNMAPLVTTMIREMGLTMNDLKLFAIANVALAIPSRVFFGMFQDKFGPRKCFSALMILSGIPCLFFAFGDSKTSLLISRLFLGLVGSSFSIGIHMVALWFKPKDIGFAEGFYGGWGNFGSAGAAMTIPWVALYLFGGRGPDGWRYAIAANAVAMMLYGVYYYIAITDGPVGTRQMKPKKASAMEVSTWSDMIKLILSTIPLYGILGVLVWRIQSFGYIGLRGAAIAYAALGVITLWQVIQILRVNVPILKKGVPEDDKYSFNNVIALNSTYFANFGAELAIVSMIPTFFEQTWKLTPAAAGLIASSFAVVNLFARPLGGVLSDRLSSRKLIIIIYMAGIGAGLFAMGLMTGAMPIVLAVVLTILCSVFVQGAEGATFSIVPMIKTRITGQMAGMAGAYGNFGAVFYTFMYTFLSASQFFYVMAACAFGSVLVCLLLLEEPRGAFAEEYHVSSVDLEIERERKASGE